MGVFLVRRFSNRAGERWGELALAWTERNSAQGRSETCPTQKIVTGCEILSRGRRADQAGTVTCEAGDVAFEKTGRLV
jgi:hypothetical protein